MQKFLNLVISGMVTGAIYSIMASGLVLTYQTSGVFNFAHAAVAFTSAYFYFQINTGQGIPIVPSIIITVVFFAPLLGLALDRIVLGRLSTAPMYARIVGTIGLLVALPNLAQWLVNSVAVDWLGLDLAKLSDFGADIGFQPPGVGPTPSKVYRLSWLGLDNVNLNSDQLAVFAVAAIVAGLLYVVLRRTRVGLEMRAQVDRDSLAALRGVNPRRTSGVAWMLSMTLAGLGGVLIAPLFQLNDNSYVFVVFASLAAVAIAGMRSIPLAFAAGLALGVTQNLIAGYKNDWLPNFLSSVSGLDAAVPYFILLVALFIVGRERGRQAGTVSDEKPAPDHRAGLPGWRRKLPWTIFTALLVLYTLGAFPWPNNPYFVRSGVLAPGLALGIVFLGFVVVTGIGGMVSLAQATFVTAGGFMAGWALQTSAADHPPPWSHWGNIPFLVRDGQLNFLVACLLGAIVAGAIGAIVAFPVRRLGALALALATFALSWVAYFVVFANSDISNGTFGYSFRFPSFNPFGLHEFDFSKSSQLVCMLLIVFGVVTLLIHNLQKSPSGRAMYAARSSQVAARTSGISPAKAQVALFALSAGIAGFGGAMYGLTAFSITATSIPPFLGLIWLAVAVTFGIRRPGGALLAGLAFTAAPVIWQNLAKFSWMPNFLSELIISPYFTPMLFGLGAINLAKNPDGLLAMIGHDRLAKKREKEREVRIAVAASELHEGEAATEVVAVTEERVLDVVAATGTEHVEAPVLLMENVVAGYGDVEVLHGVTVAVDRAQVVALLGANGAGKSTLCGVAAGTVPITSGTLTLNGIAINDASTFRRARSGLLLVPEARGIFPGLSVEENLQVLLRDPELRDKAYARFPILGERRKQIAGLLSGGEQQMLSLAPALAQPPDVLVADEPTLGLAPLAAEVVIDALRELQGMGTAILLVEEKASEVMKVADIVAFMELGRVVWMGPRDEADEERLAAAYLGGMGEKPGRMEPSEYIEQDALGLADLVARGEVSPDEVLEAALAAIDAHNPGLNAVIARRDDAARAEVAAGLPDGPLRGVPYLIKDLNGHVAGLPTTNGVRLFADAVATRDSEFVTRLRRAGAVIVGKTNTPGFGTSTSTEPSFFGPCPNPWNRDHVSGGSSGGAAAAVAGGMVPAAHATDGGGSIRIPASCCGLFGLKPTRGRVTLAPFAGESWNGLSIGHAVTRTVRDSAAILDVAGGPFPGDPYVAPAPARPYLEEVGVAPDRLRVGLLDRAPMSDVAVEPDCANALEAAARLCDTLGHHVEPTRWPELPTMPAFVLGVISATDIASKVDLRLEELGRELRDDDLDLWVHDTVERGRTITGEQYVQAVAMMHLIGRTVAAFMADYDVLLAPTMGITPPKLGVLDPNAPFLDALNTLTAMSGFTSIANLTGQPAMSVPLHRAETTGVGDGLPVGAQFVGRFGDEATLFRLASQLEAAAPWPQYASS